MENIKNEEVKSDNSKIVKIIFISIIAIIIIGIVIVSVIAINFDNNNNIESKDYNSINNSSNQKSNINEGFNKLKDAFPNTNFTIITPENKPEINSNDYSITYSWNLTDGTNQFILKEVANKSTTNNKEIDYSYYSTNYPYTLYSEQSLQQFNNDLTTLNKGYIAKYVLYDTSLSGTYTLGSELKDNNSFDKYYFNSFLLHNWCFVNIIGKNLDLNTLNNDLKLLKYKEKYSALYPSNYLLKQGISCEAYSLNENEYNNLLSTNNFKDIVNKTLIGKAIIIEGDK